MSDPRNHTRRTIGVALTRPQVRLLASIVATCAGRPDVEVWTTAPAPAARSLQRMEGAGLVRSTPGEPLRVTHTPTGLAAVKTLADDFSCCMEAMGLISCTCAGWCSDLPFPGCPYCGTPAEVA